jgi:RND family efflux transporter MFP subunit
MSSNKIFTLFLLALVMVSCNKKETSVEDLINTDNLDKMREKKTELVEQRKSLESQITQLENRIGELAPLTNVPLVSIMMVQDTTFVHFVDVQGEVATDDNLVLYPEMSGILTKLLVDDGDQVNKGQLIAQIDDAGMTQQLEQARVQAELAKTTFERQKNLWDQKIGSEIQFLQAKANFEAQQKQVATLERQLAKTDIRAPFTGTIDDVMAEQGSVVTPGVTAIVRIVSLKDMFVQADIPERYLGKVEKGKKVLVEFPVLGESVEAEVSQAASFINPANRTFSIEVKLPKTDFEVKPNLTARLKINDYSAQNTILIPTDIISENQDGEQYVIAAVEKEGSEYPITARKLITTGLAQNGMIEVKSGLEAGDRVVVEGARKVREGQPVDIIE